MQKVTVLTARMPIEVGDGMTAQQLFDASGMKKVGGFGKWTLDNASPEIGFPMDNGPKTVSIGTMIFYEPNSHRVIVGLTKALGLERTWPEDALRVRREFPLVHTERPLAFTHPPIKAPHGYAGHFVLQVDDILYLDWPMCHFLWDKDVNHAVRIPEGWEAGLKRKGFRTDIDDGGNLSFHFKVRLEKARGGHGGYCTVTVD